RRRSAERQLELPLSRPPEQAAIEPGSVASLPQAVPGAGGLEALSNHISIRTAPGLAHAVAAVVVPAAARAAHQAHDVSGTLRQVRLQPVREDVLELVRQPQEHVARVARAGVRRGADDALDLGIVD